MNLIKRLIPLFAIVAAAVLIAAALVYLGRQLVTRPDEARVIVLIEERLGQQTGDALSEKEIGARVEKGIAASVEKQLGQRKGGELSGGGFPFPLRHFRLGDSLLQPISCFVVVRLSMRTEPKIGFSDRCKKPPLLIQPFLACLLC